MDSWQIPFQKIGDSLDRLLDRITTYRLVLYLLTTYLVVAIGLGFFHKVAFTPSQIFLSAVCLLAASRAANWLMARLFKVPANHESDLITGLILALIMTPAAAFGDYVVLASAASAAMVSKYAITFRGRHVFNPAAFGAVVSIAAFHTYASWWIGTQVILPLLAVGGLLILRKMKRFLMVGTFFYIAAALSVLNSQPGHVGTNLWISFSATSLVFFATVMLTEPLTSPTSLNKSLVYALGVGVLYSANKLHFSPEEALLAGNLLTFVMAPSRSQVFSFVGRRKEAAGIYSYIFHSPKPIPFKAGQYMEWTLPGVALDARGNRRYLTISSSPSEKDLMFTVRMPDKPSGFKHSLAALKPGGQILAAQLAGDFTLASNSDQKLALFAGGVGITPFRSMAKQLIDNHEKRDIELFYAVNSPDELAFTDLFRQAGIAMRPVVSVPPPGWSGLRGYVSKDLIKANLPDMEERLFYISGPQGFVSAVRQALLELGVRQSRIITDFFPGYN